MTPINVTEIIDGRRFGTFQLRVAIWCGLLAMFDGFDTQVVAFVAPVLAPHWGLKLPAFGPVFGAGLFGLMIGALASGPLADRFGRKTIILMATTIFGIFTLATTAATSLHQLLLLRFLTGLGLGGVMPNVIALTAEYTPHRIRGRVVSVMFCGFPLGGALGGFIGAWLVPRFGWEAMFVIGGVLPLVSALAVGFAVPESIRFLVTRGSAPSKVANLLNRLYRTPEFRADQHYVMPEEKLSGFTVKHLLRDRRAIPSLLLWLTFFCNLLILYFLGAWLPAVMRAAGVPVQTAIGLTGFLHLGGLGGGTLMGWLIDRISPSRVAGLGFIVAAVAIVTIGMAGSNAMLLGIAIFCSGWCIIGGQNVINAIAAAMYPTAIRSTGVGWALGIGRIGSIIGPVVGGFLLSASFDPQRLFEVAAIPAVIAAGAIFLLGRRSVRAAEIETPVLAGARQ